MSARTSRTRTSPISRTCPRAPTPNRSSGASRKGFDFIIGTSFGYMDPMAAVAEEFPDITYLHLTGFKSNGTNFGNFFGAMEDFKYLAGMLAGSRAKADGNPKIGYMATFPIPEELRLGNAIMLGVKRTCPECTMDVRFINTWHDPIKEKDAAASLFDAGAQVVFTGADTGAVADVAQEKGKWGVTYDHPASCKVERCLTAPYWIWGPEYARIAESVKAGTYEAGYEYFDADSKAMGLLGFMEGETRSRASRACPRKTSSSCATRSPRCWPVNGPVRHIRRTDHRQHGQGDPRRGRSSSSRISISSRQAPPATSARPACTGGPTGSPSSCRRSSSRMRVRRRPTGGPDTAVP